MRGGSPPPGYPPGGGGGRHLSCLRGAQLQAQNIKEISIMLGLTIHTTADDILKRLSFLTLASIVTDAHFNKGGLLCFMKSSGSLDFSNVCFCIVIYSTCEIIDHGNIYLLIYFQHLTGWHAPES